MARDVKIILKTAADITGLSKLRRALNDNVPGVKKLETAFLGLGRSVTALGRIGANVFGGLAKGAGVLTAALAGSVREFATFNVGMARAWTMMDTGVAGFREMRSQVVDLSAELGVAKDQLAKGLYQALSAGVPKDNAISFISTAAKVAVADGSDIETAVDGITTVLNAWGMEADKADEVTDKLFKTVANGKTTFGQLAGSISQAAPVAASMGVSVDELLAGVATLTKQGMPTAQAMTVIRNALTLTNDQLGDGWRTTRTFQEALNEIATTAGNSQQALTKIFGRETVAGISALTGANFSGAASDLEAMSASAGALDGAFGKVSTETSHWPKLWQTIRAYVTDIGGALDTKLRPSIDYVTKALNDFRKGDNFQGFADGMAEAVSGFLERLWAGAMTAVDILKTSWENGPEAMAETVKTVIVEALTLGGTALVEFLRANVNVFMTLGKVVGGAIKSEILTIDIPGINDDKRRQKAAAKSLQSLTYADASELGVNLFEGLADPSGNRAAGNKILAGDARLIADAVGQRKGGQDLLAQIAGATSGSEMIAAIAEGRSNFAASAGRLATQAGISMGNIQNTARTTLGINPTGMFNRRMLALQTARDANQYPPAPPAAPAAPAGGTGTPGQTTQAIASSGAAVEKELESVISITMKNNEGLVVKLTKLKQEQEDLKNRMDNIL